MRAFTRLFAIFIILLAVAGFAAAADKPNFSGDWKIDAMKSSFGPMPPPEVYNRKIEHNDPGLKVTEEQKGAMGERTSTLSFSTDGKEVSNDLQGMIAKSTAAWDGDKLKLTTNIDAQGTAIKLQENWSLSGDGKVLTAAIKFTSPQGEFEITLVLNKQ
jgi:hypothetical protein